MKVSTSALILFCTALVASIPQVQADVHLPGKTKVDFILPLHTKWPILTDRAYFTYQGVNASKLTLNALMKMDCEYVRQMIATNPMILYRDMGVLILTQKSLEGINIATMDDKLKEEIVIAQIAKHIRYGGNLDAALYFVNEDIPLDKRFSSLSLADICHIFETEKHNLLNQCDHVDQNKWNSAILVQISKKNSAGS